MKDREKENKFENINKLEIGSGEKPTSGYLHQDVYEVPGIKLDFVSNPWQIDLKEESISEVIAIGVIEHLRFDEFDKTIKHVFNLLKPGGEFLFDVPDMKIWSEYLYNLTHGMSEKNPFPDKHIWSTVYGWQRWPGDEHKSGWIKENLIEKLRNSVLVWKLKDLNYSS